MKTTLPTLACTLIAGRYQGVGYDYAPFVCIHEANHGPDLKQTEIGAPSDVRVIANADVPSAIAYGGTPERQAARVAQIEEMVKRVNDYPKLVEALRTLLALPIVAAIGPDGVYLNPTDLWYDALVEASRAAHELLSGSTTEPQTTPPTTAQLIAGLRNARSAFVSTYLRGAEIANNEKRGSRAALAGLEMQRYAESGQKDVDALLREVGEAA